MKLCRSGDWEKNGIFIEIKRSYVMCTRPYVYALRVSSLYIVPCSYLANLIFFFVMKLIMSVPNDAFIYTSVYRFGSLYRNRKFNFHVSDKVDDFIDDNNVTFLNCRKTKCCLVK